MCHKKLLVKLFPNDNDLTCRKPTNVTHRSGTGHRIYQIVETKVWKATNF